MRESFALQCLVDAVERLPHRHNLNEVYSELSVYLDSLGETSAANILRGYTGAGSVDRVLNHLSAETLDEVLSSTWAKVPTGMDPDTADALLDTAGASNG